MKDAMFCQFVHTNSEEVRCGKCGREFSGTPSDYPDMPCDAYGPGADLKEILDWWAKTLHLTVDPKCPHCMDLMRLMNLRGKPWIRENVHWIADRLVANAARQNITLPRMVAIRWIGIVSQE